MMFGALPVKTIGIDIGGTKIAGGVFAEDGALLKECVRSTPTTYDVFLKTCVDVVRFLDVEGTLPVGIGIAGRVTRLGELADASPNMPFLRGKTFRGDLGQGLGRQQIALGNDANCMALAEAVDGAAAGYATVFGVTLGTGVGGGFVVQGDLLMGANGLAAEIGHIPLPFRQDSDGPLATCGCGQTGCIESSVCGAALARLYASRSGKQADARAIGALALAGDAQALSVLDSYYETLAKALVAVVHTFDPDAIVVAGGMVSLPGLFEKVPEFLGRYAYTKNLNTVLMPARYGALSGRRGAAWLAKKAF